MNDLFKRLKQKAETLRLNASQAKTKNIFDKIEKNNGKRIYHTKPFNDFYTFGINRKQKNKFLIALKKYSNPNKEKKYTHSIYLVSKEKMPS
ncbi:hypothetical protein [Borrelia hermsii]|nr:hypothetical protein [Borrelia hermsii]